MKPRLPAVLLSAVVLSACAPLGPRAVTATRPAYNVAVQQTNDQELLLNLVRIRYRDTTYFTSVERIAATQEFNQGLSGTATETRTGNSLANQATAAGGTFTSVFARALGLAPSVQLNEKPTVFYAPLEGEKFVRQMMTPMNPDVLLLLVRSGWSIDRVFSLGVHEINGLKNAPTGAGVTPSRAPEFRDFRETVRLMRMLQREHLLDLVKPAGGDGIEMRFTRGGAQREEAVRLKTLLGLNSARNSFKLIAASESPNSDTVAISTRPVMSALNYLSQGVEVPDRDFKAGVARQTTHADGTPFNWQDLLGDVFRVQSASEAPADASTAIEYRGTYFYIPNSDLESKATFVLLTQLMALHSAQAPAGPAMSFSFGK